MPERGVPSPGNLTEAYRGMWEHKELPKGTSLAETLSFADALTHERNERELPTPQDKILHLMSGYGDLLTTYTRVLNGEKQRALFDVILPKLMLRIFTALQGLGTREEFTEKLILNYTKCIRCGNLPCTCNTVERASVEYKHDRIQGQEQWTIKQWQDHLNSLYGPINNKRQLIAVINQFFAEVKESSDEVLRMTRAQRLGDTKAAEEFRLKAIEELAQSFAWLIGVANHHEAKGVSESIDLERLFVQTYGKGCPRCNQIPCVCGEFSWLEPRKDPEALGKTTL